ncbi:MAG: hypothetical protein WCE54_04860 [Ignavibacteriaceae bacterium]
MKHLMIFWKIIFTIALLSVIMPAQENNWSVIKLSGDTLLNCSFQGINDSLLTFENNGTINFVPVDSISRLFFHKESHPGTGAAIGAAIGVVLGTVLGSATYQKPKDTGLFGGADFGGQTISAVGGGLLGGIVGSIAGLVIGASIGGNESYDISKRDHTQKVMIIRMLMSK